MVLRRVSSAPIIELYDFIRALEFTCRASKYSFKTRSACRHTSVVVRTRLIILRIGDRSQRYAEHRARETTMRKRVCTIERPARHFLIVYPICLRKQGQSAGKTRPLTRTIPRPCGRACQRCIIGFLYAHVK